MTTICNYIVEEPWTCCACGGISTPTKARVARFKDDGERYTKEEAKKKAENLNKSRKCFCKKG